MPHLPAVKRFVSKSGARIYRIPCLAIPGLSGRVYLVLGAGPPTIVDTGNGEPESIRHVLEGLDTVRTEFNETVRLGDVERILITHAHIDHVGGLWELVRQTGAEVAAHPLDGRMVVDYEERAALANHAMTRFLMRAGVPPDRWPQVLRGYGYTPGLVRSVPVDFFLSDGLQLDGLRIVHTPGHTPGHVCILIDNVLLAGDHILFRTVTQQWPESMAAHTGLAHYLDSLEKIARIEAVDLVLPGHEPPIRDVPKRLDEIRESHRRRLDRVLDILAKAPHAPTISEVTETMYSCQEGFHAMLALTDVGSRIEHLDQRGRLAIANLDEVADQQDPVYRYRPA
ncbi:MAG: MBL fold metallo-hydrolase [Planctomycetes bacterium]|nr:MBL fold metallo-hydrolase [Planctomycetota bacterium]